MTTRPRLDSLWASKDISQIADPDLDSDHPSGEGGVGKYVKGWISEREPHQWANFIYQRYDKVALEYASRGFSLYRSGVSYTKGALVWADNGKCYTALQDTSNDPITSADWGLTLASLGESQMLGQLSLLKARIDAHGALRNNPHNVTCAQFGGSTKAAIDAAVTSVDSSTGSHTDSKANPHTVTAIQIGSVPAAGGEFDGTVGFNSETRFGSEALFSTSDHMAISAKNKRFGITNEDAMYSDGFPMEQYVCHTGNYHKVRMRSERLFAVPMPDLVVPLIKNLSSPSVGNYILYTTFDSIVFGEQGLVVPAGGQITITGLKGMKTLSVIKNGELKIYNDITTDELISIVGVGNIRDVKAWCTELTDFQRSMLVRDWRNN